MPNAPFGSTHGWWEAASFAGEASRSARPFNRMRQPRPLETIGFHPTGSRVRLIFIEHSYKPPAILVKLPSRDFRSSAATFDRGRETSARAHQFAAAGSSIHIW